MKFDIQIEFVDVFIIDGSAFLRAGNNAVCSDGDDGVVADTIPELRAFDHEDGFAIVQVGFDLQISNRRIVEHSNFCTRWVGWR